KQPTPYPNLRAGGRELAPKLEAYREANPIVLGIALAGVPVAHEVANYLGAPLDLIIIRRLLVPEGPASQLCAMNVSGSLVIDDGIKVPSAASTPLDYFLSDALAELSSRAPPCR